MVEYAYDSWGKLLSCTGTLATSLGALNPFRYRGYVYDEETDFYYLKSRYYDPETCRFISADVYLSTGQGVIGHNCYAYCLNNPANMVDDGGNSSEELNKESIKDSAENAVAFFLIAAYIATFQNDGTYIEDICIKIKQSIKTSKSQKAPFHNQSVYIMIYKNGENKGEVGYVGRTNNPERREEEHARSKPNLEGFSVVRSGLTVNQARIAEQAIISAYIMEKNGGQLVNLRREIATKRLSGFKNDLTVLSDLVLGYSESELLCFLGR